MYEALFAATFLAQLVTLSVYLPRQARRHIERAARADGGSPGSVAAARRYVGASNLVVIAGLVALTAILVMADFRQARPVLLALGGVFVLQVAPLVIFNVPGAVRREMPATGAHRRPSGRRLRLFDAVHPVAVAVAAFLAAAYVTMALAVWDGAWDTQVVKIGVFTATNLAFVGTIAWTLRSRPFSELADVAPTFVYLSIGLSLYYFGKQLIAEFDLQELRPVMMSLWMQLLAAVAISRLFVRRESVA